MHLTRQQLQGRTIHLKVRVADFHTITRAKSHSQPTDMTHEIGQVAGELLADALPIQHQGVRLLGVGVSGFAQDALVQRTLFDDESRKKQRQLDAVADAVRATFGSSALNRASGLLNRSDPTPGGHSS